MNTQLPPTSELFPQEEFVGRHPTIMSKWRVQWALRHRHKNGLAEVEAVFESKGKHGEVLIHEPNFLKWFLGLSGRAKPRAARRKRRRSAS